MSYLCPPQAVQLLRRPLHRSRAGLGSESPQLAVQDTARPGAAGRLHRDPRRYCGNPVLPRGTLSRRARRRRGHRVQLSAIPAACALPGTASTAPLRARRGPSRTAPHHPGTRTSPLRAAMAVGAAAVQGQR